MTGPQNASIQSDATPDVSRIRDAEVALAGSDPYMREAGAQSLAGLVAPDALRLLEKACSDREGRVVEGGMRALIASVSTGSPDAEAVLLRALTRNRNSTRIREI